MKITGTITVTASASISMLCGFGLLAASIAADLNGSAIPDLEERVAELEATTARKGTRKVSLTISGQVNQSILWVDIDGLGDDKRIGDNANSPSVFRMVGEAKLEKFSAGFIYEFGIADDIGIRHAAVWVGSSAGKVWLGQTSSATDGVAEISTANTVVASRMLTLDYGVSLGIPIGFDGHRYQLVRYDTPTMGGFTGSAAYAPNASLMNGDIWDAALRYAGEFGGFRVAAGVGLRQDDMIIGDLRTVVGSASVMHMGTGLFASASGGVMSDEFMGADGLRAWHVQAGIERNFFGIGATTLYAEYADTSFSGVGFNPDIGFIGGGVVQSIDGLGTDLYLSMRQYDVLGVDATAVMAGARVKF